MPRNVLLVEDDDVWKTIIIDYLPPSKFSVRSAKTWTAAHNEIRRGNFDFLVLDLNLGLDPSDGIGILEILREEKRFIDTLVISNTSSRSVILAVRKFDFVKSIIVKPSFFDELDAFFTFFGLSTSDRQLTPRAKSRIRDELKGRDRSGTTRVFVSHGRDRVAIDRVTRILSDLRVVPISLEDETAGSATIIELFEKSIDVVFGIHIFSADDVGRLRDTSNKQLVSRGRQNVVFEAGYLFGKLGRQNNLVLLGKGVELPSDMAGIEYISLERSDYDLRQEIARSFKTAGVEFHI